MDTSLRPLGAVPTPHTTQSGNNSVASGKALPVSQTKTSSDTVKEAPAQKAVDTGKSLAEELKATQDAVRKINDTLREQHRDIEFSVDEGSGKSVVKVIHSESGEVIRQFPPEVVLNFASAFAEGSASLLEDFA